MRRLLISLICVCSLGLNFAVAKDQTFDKKVENFLSWDYKNTSAKIGGFVMLVVNADINGSIPGHNFYVSMIPTEQDSRIKNAFGIDASRSRLNLEVKQKTKLGDVKLYVEGDFCGVSNAFRLRHAYVRLNQFTLGQTWSLMCDAAATFPTADVVGNPSRTHFRTPQVAYVQKFDSGVSFGASLEAPSEKISFNTNPSVEQVRRICPDLPMFVQYAKGASHIRVSGVLRGLNYYDVLNAQLTNRFGWGAQLSGSLRVVPMLELYAQGIYGKGIGKYINDLQVLSVDLMPNIAENGQMSALPMYGASAGLNLKLSKTVNFSAGYARMGIDDVQGYVQDDTYHIGNYAVANIFWKPIKPMTLALEYLHGQRINMNGEQGRANTINLACIYSF